MLRVEKRGLMTAKLSSMVKDIGEPGTQFGKIEGSKITGVWVKSCLGFRLHL